MEMRNVTMDQFEQAVANANVNYGGNLAVHPDAHEMGTRIPKVVGRLWVNDSRANGARTSWQGRHTRAACWHAFRDVIREIFKLSPDAVVITGLARYTAQNFESVYVETAYTNVGSLFQPSYMPDNCVGDCAGDRY